MLSLGRRDGRAGLGWAGLSDHQALTARFDKR